MEKIKKNPMEYEDLLRLILRMSFPVMLSMLVQSMYNITDSFFVAQFNEKALRATSLSYPIQIIIVAFGVGTGIGVNSLISRYQGEGRYDDANQVAMHGVILSILSWSIFLLFRFLLLEKFVTFFTKDPEVIEMGIEYLGLVSGFSIFSLIQINIEKTIQGTGNTVLPMIIQLVGAATNIILDPIMIFGLFGFPQMGIRGAAIATLIGQAFGAALGLIFLFNKTNLRLKLNELKPSKKIVENIYEVGLPTILMQSVPAFITSILNLIVIRYSEVAVSVLGIYLKLESFVMMPLFGLGQGILPIMGYNFGARNKDRVKGTLKYGFKIGLLIMALGLLLFQVFPRQLMGLFAETEEMVEMGVYTLRIISLGYVFASISVISTTLFQALGLGKLSLLITLLRSLIIVVPLAYIFSFVGLNYIWMAYPIAEITTVVFSIYMVKKVIEHKVNNLSKNNM